MDARAQSRGEESLTTDRVRKLLEEAIGKVLHTITPNAPGANPRRLVVFIDDLDRCEPDAVFRVLQSIKVYLSLSNCVFVLGINQQAIIEALARHYGARTDDEFKKYSSKASSYIEKICGNVYSLPPPPNIEQVFVEEWIRKLPEPLLGDALEAGLKETGEWIRCLPPNPRRLKMLSNSLARAWNRLCESDEWKTSAGNQVERQRYVRALVCVTYCFQFHHSLFLNWRSGIEAGLTLLDQWLGRSPELTPAGRKKFEDDYCLHHPNPRIGHTADEPLHLPDRANSGFFWIGPLYQYLSQAALTTPAPVPPPPAGVPGLGATPDQVLPPSQPAALVAAPVVNLRVAAFDLAFRHVY